MDTVWNKLLFVSADAHDYPMVSNVFTQGVSESFSGA